MLLTLAQSTLGALFLLDLKIHWWEAAGLFVLWGVQFALSPVIRTQEIFIAAYAVWIVAEIVRVATGRRGMAAVTQFSKMWKVHVRRAG